MSDYDELRQKIREVKKDSGSWQSDIKHLLAVIDAAEEWGVDISCARKSGLSNLRAITPEARRAVKREDIKELGRLFRMASELSNRELRLQLGKPFLQFIKVFYSVENDREMFEIHLTREQYEELKRNTKLVFDFREFQSSL